MGALTLLDAHFDRAEAAPGDPVLLTAVWEATEQPEGDLGLSLTLVSPGGDVAATYDLPPTVAWHPTSAWKQGDVWTGLHSLRLPAQLENGSYAWLLRVCPAQAGWTIQAPGSRVGTLEIGSPARVWTPPPVDLPVDAQFGGAITLVGANLGPHPTSVIPGDSVSVTLVWRADVAPQESYRVFLHLLAPDGSLAAQSDGEPADWTRPTSGWAENEIVVDERELTVPTWADPGKYMLQAGLYTIEGGRLTTSLGEDSATVAVLTISDAHR
jgi:hypothetical protein